jgi:hypothetical protein
MEVLAPKTSSSFSAIISGVDDAIHRISSILDSSSKAKDKFKTQWTTSIENYDHDIAIIDEELAKLPPSWSRYLEMKEKEREGERQRKRKRLLKVTQSCSSHALNFHMKAENQEKNEMFILPPDTSTVFDDDDIFYSSNYSKSKSMNNTKSSRSNMTHEQRKKIEEERKFKAREQILDKLEEMRNNDERVIEQLTTPEECESDPLGESSERESQSLERQQQQNINEMLKLITLYKPQTVCRRNPKANINQSRKIVQQKKHKLKREMNMINDISNYCSIENLPTTTTIGESSSLKILVKEATKSNHNTRQNIFGSEEDADYTNEEETYYSNNAFESDEDDYDSDDFET